MNKLKAILGGTSATLGITGAVVTPLLYKSSEDTDLSAENPSVSEEQTEQKPNRGKAVAGSWPQGITYSQQFENISYTLAPFLVDLSATDDQFWEQRVKSKNSLTFNGGKGEFKDAWSESLSDEKIRVGLAKKICESFKKSLNGYYQGKEFEDMFELCSLEGIPAPEGMKKMVNKFGDSCNQGTPCRPFHGLSFQIMPDLDSYWDVKGICQWFSDSKVCQPFISKWQEEKIFDS